MMNCKHHSEHDPANGEPKGTTAQIGLGGEPCPYCWKIYAKHLCDYINEEDLDSVHDKERIIELENQKAVLQKAVQAIADMAGAILEARDE